MGHANKSGAAAAQTAQTPATVTNIEDRSKRDRGDRAQLYSRKAKFKGPTASLTLYVKEQKGGKFVVHALLVKGDSKDAKKEKGVVNEFPNKADAEKKFEELSKKCLDNGWTLATTVTKSSFDDIPVAV